MKAILFVRIAGPRVGRSGTQSRSLRTNIVLDDDLVKEARRLTGIRTKREVVHRALVRLIESEKRVRLGDFAGKIRFASGFDPKKQRDGRRS